MEETIQRGSARYEISALWDTRIEQKDKKTGAVKVSVDTFNLESLTEDNFEVTLSDRNFSPCRLQIDYKNSNLSITVFAIKNPIKSLQYPQVDNENPLYQETINVSGKLNVTHSFYIER